MKKFFAEIQHKWYRRLSSKLIDCIPKEYDPIVAISPSTVDKGKDMVLITIKVPHDLVKKLMWSFKVWKEN